jgi:hypothetical protein
MLFIFAFFVCNKCYLYSHLHYRYDPDSVVSGHTLNFKGSVIKAVIVMTTAVK